MVAKGNMKRKRPGPSGGGGGSGVGPASMNGQASGGKKKVLKPAASSLAAIKVKVPNKSGQTSLLVNGEPSSEQKQSSDCASVGHAHQEDSSLAPNCCCCCTSSNCNRGKGDNAFKPCQDKSVTGDVMNMSQRGVRQVLDCVNNGTIEIRDLLFNECELIFECRVCRQLFRSVANFLSHKRQFCTDHLCESMVLFDPTTIKYVDDGVSQTIGINSEAALDITEEPSTSVEPEIKVIQSAKEGKRKTLLQCVARIQQANERPESILSLRLKSIPGNANAVLQERDEGPSAHGNSTEAATDTGVVDIAEEEVEASSLPVTADATLERVQPRIKVTVKVPSCESKVERSSNKDGVARVRKPKVRLLEEMDFEGAAKTSKALNCSGSSLEDDSQGTATVACEECGSSFVSNKTLRVHMNTIHASSRLLFPCPFCSLTFKQICNATRHLIQVHKKGKNDVKQLREVVKSKARPITDEDIVSAQDEEEDEEEDDDDSDAGDDEAGDNEAMDLNSFEVEFEPMDIEKDGAVWTKPIKPVNCTNSIRTRRQATHDKDSTSAIETIVADGSSSPDDEDQDLKENDAEGSVNGNSSTLSCKGCGTWFARVEARTFHEKSCREFRTKSSSDATPLDHLSAAQALFAQQQQNSISNYTCGLNLSDEVLHDLSTITSTKKLRCNMCPSLCFTNLNHLNQHAVTHLGFDVLKCKGCEFRTLSRAALDQHLGRSHNIPEAQRSKLMVNLSAPLKNSSSERLVPPTATMSCPPPPKLVEVAVRPETPPTKDEASEPSVDSSAAPEFMPPPLYDSRGGPPVSVAATTPTSSSDSSASSSSSSTHSPTCSTTSGSSPCGIKLVIQRKVTDTVHSKKHKPIYAVTTVEHDRL